MESLCNVITGPDEDPFETPVEVASADFGVQFTEIFAKKKENIEILLSILEKTHYKILRLTLKLLMSMLKNHHREIQKLVLECPNGVSTIMDLLTDVRDRRDVSREVIRNDAIILLVLLSRSNFDIQQILAFGDAFTALSDVIKSEGYTDGGVVVEDCLLVLQNLLRNNIPNQNLFKQGNFVEQLLLPFLEPLSNEYQWHTQRESIIVYFLQVVRTLVSPSNSSQTTVSAQKIMNKCGILKKLCDLLMFSGIPPGLLTELINTVAEVIRGNQQNQEYFGSLMGPTVPAKPVLVILLMSMVNAKQTFELRKAVLYCFQCLLLKNDLGQAKIIETLLPDVPIIDSTSPTAGPLLCGGLYSPDPVTNWLTSVALMHTLVDNKTQKELLLRVQLANDANSQPIALISHICSTLQQEIKFQKRISLLMLLSTWLSDCPLAVTHFLHIPTNIPLLTSQVCIVESDDVDLLYQGVCAFILGLCIMFNDDSVPSFTKNDLRQLIVRRVTVETFANKLSFVSRSPHYSMAAQRPQMKFVNGDDLTYDFEFCNLFKKYEHVILNCIRDDDDHNVDSVDPIGPNSQYIDLIRKQDEELQSLRPLIKERENWLEQLEERDNYIRQLNDQIAILKAQNIAENEYLRNENYQLRNNCDQMIYSIQQLKDELSRVKNYKITDDTAYAAEEGFAPQMIDKLRTRNEDLQKQLLSVTQDLERIFKHLSPNDPQACPQNL